MSQILPPALPTNANGVHQSGDTRKLLEDLHGYLGIILRGWKFIAICILAAVTAAGLYIAGSKPTYRAASRLLVIQQSGHPVHVAGSTDPFQNGGRSEESLATHLLLIKSSVIVEQALTLSDTHDVSVGAVIGNLIVKQTDPAAKVVDLGYKSGSAEESRRVLNGVIDSYKLFLKKNYQKNTSDVISLIMKARNELNDELKSLEKAYVQYRQKNPAYSADASGHTFVARRLDQWDQALNQFSARAVQLQSQLELSKKLSQQGLDAASIERAVSQVSLNSTSQGTSSPTITTNVVSDGSFESLKRERAEIETQRRTAELLLDHFRLELDKAIESKQVTVRELEKAFSADPEISNLRARLRSLNASLNTAKRLSRSSSDYAVQTYQRQIQGLEREIQRLWIEKKPIIAEGLVSDLNPDLASAVRKAETDLITLKARESALQERLDQVTAEELQKLKIARERLVTLHGVSHASVAELDQKKSTIEDRRDSSIESPRGEKTNTLIESMTRSLESIEAMRSDLQKKFEEDLNQSKKAEISQLEESNLRSNLERQRLLFNSVVDQLKQAQLVSDFDSVTTQTIEPVSVSAEKPKTVSILLLASIVGVLTGTLIAFGADLLEARVRTLAEIRKLVDLPVIGIIPFIQDKQLLATATMGLLSHQKPRSALAESYKTTRTNLEFLRRNRRAQILLVTSAHPGDGKSTTTSNLAITMANTGRKVLLIDGDLRKPTMHQLFDLAQEGGLSEALQSHQSIERLVKTTLVNNLDLMTTGRDISNPAELLASERLTEVLEELRPLYDMIIIDSSPLLAVTDGSIIAANADGIILVIKISSIRRHDLERTTELIRTLGAPVFGMVINGVTREQIGYGYGGYGYGYGGYGYGYGYGRNGYGKQTPYGPSVEASHANGNGKLQEDWKPSVTPNGNLSFDQESSGLGN